MLSLYTLPINQCVKYSYTTLHTDHFVLMLTITVEANIRVLLKLKRNTGHGKEVMLLQSNAFLSIMFYIVFYTCLLYTSRCV